MKLNPEWKFVYFIGIGGIGMSALARWFHANGYQVAGYDKTTTALTDALEKEGIPVIFDERMEVVPGTFSDRKENTLVVYTPAVPAGHPQLTYFRDNGFTLKKRAGVLGMIAGEMTTIGVAGTHGKTTTSSMVAHLLRHARVNTAAFLGGITNNYNSNLLLNEPAAAMQDVFCVVEADEFDRSFLTLYPDMAVVTATDADHLDIYGEHDHLLASFQAYVDQIKNGGVLFLKKGLPLKGNPRIRVYEYGLEEGAYHAGDVRVENARFVFDLHYPEGTIRDIRLQLPGFHNVENAVAAAGIALQAGLEPEAVRDGLTTFAGVRRRFEYVLEGERVFIDDYAHHPAEITAFLSSVRALYPGRRITAVFQPHLFTRTRDFADAFAESLDLADQLYLLDIYPAREQPIEGVDAAMLLAKVSLKDKQLVTKTQLLEELQVQAPDILVTIGAGDIDKLVVSLKEILQNALFHNR